MNCKPGDLAIVVKSTCGNEGKIVRCLGLIGKSHTFRNPDGSLDVCGKWQIDRPLKNYGGVMVLYANDSALRPIRDPGDDAVDETLLRLPSPRQEVAA